MIHLKLELMLLILSLKLLVQIRIHHNSGRMRHLRVHLKKVWHFLSHFFEKNSLRIFFIFFWFFSKNLCIAADRQINPRQVNLRFQVQVRFLNHLMSHFKRGKFPRQRIKRTCCRRTWRWRQFRVCCCRCRCVYFGCSLILKKKLFF